MNNIISEIELTNARLKQHLPVRKRLFFNAIPIEKMRAVLLYGTRGVGKTTFLLDKIKN
jgi:predicted AAA+ superfamily ATPase